MSVEQGKLRSLGPTADAKAILDAALAFPENTMVGLVFPADEDDERFREIVELLEQEKYQGLKNKLYFFPVLRDVTALALRDLATFVGAGGYALAKMPQEAESNSSLQQGFLLIEQGCQDSMKKNNHELQQLRKAYEEGRQNTPGAQGRLKKAKQSFQALSVGLGSPSVQVVSQLENIQENLKGHTEFTVRETSGQAALEITWAENGDQRKVTCAVPPEAPQDVEYQSLPREGGMAAIAKVLAAQFKDQPIPLEEVSDLRALIEALPKTCKISTQDLSEESKKTLKETYGLSESTLGLASVSVSALRKPEKTLHTVGDGNCGYNAIALAMKIQYLAEEDGGPWHRWLASAEGELFRQCFCEKRSCDLKDFLGAWEDFCRTQDDSMFQKALAPVLRQLNYAYSYQKMNEDVDFIDRLLMIIQVDMTEALREAILHREGIEAQRQYFVAALAPSIPNQEVRERLAFCITDEEWGRFQFDVENIDAFVSEKFSKEMADHSLLEQLISSPFEQGEYASQNGLAFLAEFMGMQLTIEKNGVCTPYYPSGSSDRSIFISHSGAHWSAMAYQSDLDKVAARQQRSGMPSPQPTIDEADLSALSASPLSSPL